jgi:chromosome segregation ATPase
MHKENAARLRMKLAASSSEITKGNQIIAKLQSDGQALRGKLKLKQAVVQQLQEQGSQKEASLHSADRGASELRARIAELTNDKERADEGCAWRYTEL